MTVQELIDALSACDRSVPVYVDFDREGGNETEVMEIDTTFSSGFCFGVKIK